MARSSKRIKIFLCGDVMIGRGIDQILPYPCNPQLYEGWAGSAMDYVELAEKANGEIEKPADFSYVWGAALEELERERPDVRIINLETSLTRSEAYVPKGINYRASPENARCLAASGIDCCTLANNHVLDWGQDGLLETLDTLEKLGIATAGAGRNLREAWAPAILDLETEGRVLIFSCASETSGAPPSWAASHDRPGIAHLPDFSDRSVAMIAEEVARAKRPNDVAILSLHFGPNWGYSVPDEHRWFAEGLIDKADISILHGHSSHHAKGIEVYRDRLILYGCGDFLNDYEGIAGYEDFRGELALMYFAEIDGASGNLAALEMAPLRIRHFRLNPPTSSDVAWLRNALDRESKIFGARVETGVGGRLALSWPGKRR